MGEALTCDLAGCLKVGEREGMIGWVRVELVGIDIRTLGEPPWPRFYCSRQHASEALQ